MAIGPNVSRITAEEAAEAVKAVEQYGGQNAAAKALGVDRSIIRRRIVRHRELAQQGYAPDFDLTHRVPDGLRLKGTSIRYDGDGQIQQYWNKTQIQGREVEETIQLPDPKKIVKTATLYDQQGKVTQQWVSEKPQDAQREALWIEFAAGLAADLPKLDPIAPPSGEFNDKLMTFIPFGDPHFGLYCWADEVGNDFDLDIAKRDLCGAVDYLVAQGPKASRCVIANLGDFYHIDNMDGVTPQHGHRLDVDTRLGKVVKVGVAALRQSIDTALRKYPVVELINAIGNHDPVLSQATSILLATLYENEPRVIIHDTPTRRHYVRFGSVLVGVTHGDKTKDEKLPGIMATERAVDWGLTRHRYFHRGHHHHDEKMEYNGCIVEQHRTLAAGDSYAVAGGWLAGRDMKSITYHADFGEVSRLTCSIDLLRGLQQSAAA